MSKKRKLQITAVLMFGLLFQIIGNEVLNFDSRLGYFIFGLFYLVAFYMMFQEREK